MKDMIENASALHNWKQRNAILKSRPMPNSDDLRYQFLKLEFLLARAITPSNYRKVAALAALNSFDLIELVTKKLGSIGVGGLKAAIDIERSYGVITCLQYLNSL